VFYAIFRRFRAAVFYKSQACPRPRRHLFVLVPRRRGRFPPRAGALRGGGTGKSSGEVLDILVCIVKINCLIRTTFFLPASSCHGQINFELPLLCCGRRPFRVFWVLGGGVGRRYTDNCIGPVQSVVGGDRRIIYQRTANFFAWHHFVCSLV